MTTPTRWCLCVVGLLIAVAAGAQPQGPPTITIEQVERDVTADASWRSEDPDGPSDDDTDEVYSDSPGTFLETVQADTDHARATLWQDSRISSFQVHGSSQIEAQLTPDPYAGKALASSTLSLLFTIPAESPFVLQGAFEFDHAEGEPLVALGSVSLIGADPFISKFVSPSDPEEDWTFLFAGTAPADSLLILGVTVQIQFEKDPDLDLDYTGRLYGAFFFTLDFGDRDGDGLMDVWETDGIDVDGDNHPEIDLRGMGADPNKKDLFVEVDVMQDVAYSQAAIDKVVLAFAEAPARAVDNPNLLKGVKLHVITDGDRPGHEAIAAPAGGGLPLEYYQIKDQYFGSPQDRGHPLWSQIRAARLKVFRYCLWADTFKDENDEPRTGQSEAIPSNDFLIAAGFVASHYSLPGDLTNALAGTFMHELGHTLSLRHGGGPDDEPNYKPNYLSVMNYAYQMPWNAITNLGTNGREAWRLDYSRTTMNTLDELALVETEGLNGPQGRKILFNSSPAGTDSKINIAWARFPTVDWNNSGVGIPPDPDPYTLDISNLTNQPAPEYDFLESNSDWERLWYHLAGNFNFDDRVPWRHSSPAEVGISEEEILAILNAEWVDQTAAGDLIFADDFEAETTNAWSESVP